jgi:hypothetical protein
MIIQTPMKKLNVQYKKVKEEAKKLMLNGDMKAYFQKLIEVISIEDAYRNELTRQMKAA